MPSRHFLDPPHAIAVDLTERDAVVTFDKPLVVQPIAAANWLVHLQLSGTLVADTAEIVPPNQVALTFAETLDAQSIQYLATPADVIGAPPNNLPVQAFDFPL